MSEIDLKTELLKFCQSFNQNIKIKDVSLDLNLKSYKNINVIDEIYGWQSCLEILGKKNIFMSKDLIKVLYCLLTDSCILENINGIDLYNPILNRFLQIVCLSSKRKVKLKVFPICNTIIIIDFKGYPKYKIYELYNIDQVKEYYETNKINFDTVIKDIKLEPIFTGNLMDLKKDYKILSLGISKETHIRILEKFLVNYKKIEKNIIKEYKKFKKLNK